jgi:ribulose-5-phosphate 4-epimerase/fuculose-1-phosphate aldolase
MAMGRDLAKRMGSGVTALMRGHGATVAGTSIRHAVYVSVYLEVNARLQKEAMDMGDVRFLTPGEIDNVVRRTGSFGITRAWENWCRRAGRSYRPEQG